MPFESTTYAAGSDEARCYLNNELKHVKLRIVRKSPPHLHPNAPAEVEIAATQAADELRAIATDAMHLFDIVLVTQTDSSCLTVTDGLDRKKKRAYWNKKRWTQKFLKKKFGFKVLRRSSVVIDVREGEVALIVAVGGDQSPIARRVRDAARRIEPMHTAMSTTFSHNIRRPDDNGAVVVSGLRFCEYDTPGGAGYYRPLRPNAERDAVTHGLVDDMAEAVSGIERDISPAAAGARLAVGDLISPHLGPSPLNVRKVIGKKSPSPLDVRKVICKKRHGVKVVGVSKGYVSPPHQDHTLVMETVVWDSRKLSHAQQYGFACLRLGIIVALRGKVYDSVMVMVPGRDLHGTLYLKGGRSDHGGFGTVIVTKNSLASDQAQNGYITKTGKRQRSVRDVERELGVARKVAQTEPVVVTPAAPRPPKRLRETTPEEDDEDEDDEEDEAPRTVRVSGKRACVQPERLTASVLGKLRQVSRGTVAKPRVALAKPRVALAKPRVAVAKERAGAPAVRGGVEKPSGFPEYRKELFYRKIKDLRDPQARVGWSFSSTGPGKYVYINAVVGRFASMSRAIQAARDHCAGGH